MSIPDFEEAVLVHLDAAFNLAIWLLRDRQIAEDVVQDAMLRALTYFKTFKGINARAWILQIVRNAAFEHLRATKTAQIISLENFSPLSDQAHEATADTPPLVDAGDNPEVALMRERSREEIMRALEKLPLELRECIVLREFEELSYKEIASITATPIGTIMSRLWRARQSLVQLLAEGY